MVNEKPPTIDPVAASRWAARAHPASPWLHEEVARRMAERLEVIRLPVQRWADWEPARGGAQGHDRVAACYPKAECFLVSAQHARAQDAIDSRANGWWGRWLGRSAVAQPTTVVAPPEGSVQLVWANMLAHQVADPAALLADWRRALAVDGFVMFSCLGPDTLKGLRDLYACLGWPPPAQEFTDMHDWGDQLVAAGFAEPVMDMEQITLTFETPERLLAELRGLGRNLHPARHPGLRTPRWHDRLQAALGEQLRTTPDGRLALGFEVIYGHALKAAPRHALGPRTEIPLDELRATLQRPRNNSHGL